MSDRTYTVEKVGDYYYVTMGDGFVMSACVCTDQVVAQVTRGFTRDATLVGDMPTMTKPCMITDPNHAWTHRRRRPAT